MNLKNEERQAAGDPPPFRPILITLRQFCELIQCGPTKANELVRTGAVKSVLIGRSRRIVLADAERLIAEALTQHVQS